MKSIKYKKNIKKVLLLSTLLSTAVFADGLTLSKSYEAALNYEAKIKSLDYQQKVKKIEIDMAESRLYPQIDASGTYQRRRYEYRGVNRDENYHSYSLSLNQMLYHPEVLAQIESSELQYDLSSLNLTKQKQLIAYNITDTYLQILRIKNSIKVAEAYLDTARVHYQQIEKKFQLRLANKMDYLESKVLLKEAEIRVEQERSSLMVSKMRLKSLTGIEVGTLPDVDFESIDVTKLSLDNQASLGNSLELGRAQKSFELSKKDIDISEFGHYPKLDLRGSFSNLSSKEIINEYQDDRRVMLTLSIPIYKGGYVSSEIQKNKLLLSAASQNMEDIKREESVKYDEFKAQYYVAMNNILLYKESKLSAKAYLDSVNLAYEKGLKSILDVEDAKKKFTETQYKLIDSIYQLIRAYTGVLNITGKMDEEHLAQLDNLLGI
ncbi:MAG TPA: TolC family protein [Campylobacterales bacterium]|nr:TolC family protein [Campylobacterales bacterium]